MKAHPLTRAIFNIVVIWLITEAHCGTSFPWALHNVVPLVAGPVVHDIHHTKGTVNFQKFFKHLDWLFGTLESEPTSTIYADAFIGEG
jgi:sterol desaturase/sphingolipid hydroxylase (fatty acid hydroxylase superfamily)